MEELLVELIDEGSEFWLNTATKELFYLCKFRPMRKVAKHNFNSLLEAGVIALVETCDEIKIYKAICWAEEHEKMIKERDAVSRWLSNTGSMI